MQPSIRKMLLSVPASSDDQTDNVFYQMQVFGQGNTPTTLHEFFADPFRLHV